MKTDFKPYKVGTVFNPVKRRFENIEPVNKLVEIDFPSRLNAMAIDPSKITSNKNMVYTPGEVVFSIQLFRRVMVELSNKDNELVIDKKARRFPLIRHSYHLMKNALGFSDGLKITVDNSNEIRHAGLGSSSNLVSSVATAINEIYGNPLTPAELLKYTAQNHGEEIDDDEEMLIPVQCIGGSAASGLFKGGLIVIAGESTVIKTMDIDQNYDVIIGIPTDYKEMDSEELLKKEIENLDKFLNTGKKHGKQIAYNILHKGLPGMVQGDLKPFGDIIYEYRFKMGSIKNCSFCYPPMNDISKKISYLKADGYADVLALSSVGPGFFAISKSPEICINAFEKLGLKVYKTKINNDAYKVLQRKSL